MAALEWDASLMLRVRGGDQASFALLVERYRGPVIHYLYRMVRNQAVAEELAQEVFLRVYRSRASYQPTAKFASWLFRIATRLGLNCIRNGRTEKIRRSFDGPEDSVSRQVPDRGRTVEQEMLYRARMKEVRQAVEALPLKQRAAVLMHKYQELEYSQIAKALKCSEAAVRSMLFRAYESLRSRLVHMA